MTEHDTDTLVAEVQQLFAGKHPDPYGLYERLRVHAPFLELPDGMIALSRWEDVRSVLSDGANFSSQKWRELESQRRVDALDDPAEKLLMEDIFTFHRRAPNRNDPPEHTRLRGAFRKHFVPRKVADMAPELERFSNRLLDEWRPGESIEMHATYSLELPMLLMQWLVGSPLEDSKLLHDLSIEIFPRPRTVHSATEAIKKLDDYINGLVERHARTGEGDLLRTLLAARDEGVLSDEEVRTTVVHLVFAGHETTAALISTGILTLLRNRDQWNRLVADPALAPKIVEEVLRYEAPVQALRRMAVNDVEVGGCPIKAGTPVAPMLGSANRDETRFDEADHFDPARPKSDHVAFGLGLHFCLGSPVARLTAQTAFTTISRRFPNLELLDEEIDWSEKVPFRAPLRLHVRP